MRSYDAIGSGLGLVVDSYGMLSLCVDRGSAARELNVGQGDLVVFSRLEQSDQNGTITTSVKIAPKR